MTHVSPPLDPELAAALAIFGEGVPEFITPDMIPSMRAAMVEPITDMVIDEAGLEIRDVKITSYDDTEIVISIVQAKDRAGTGPGIYYIHGGGMILGTRRTGIDALFGWIHRYNAVLVTVEYRLAPEHPDPTPVEDCYAGLVWSAEHSAELGIEPDRLLIAGASAGGGLAAGTTLLARDRRGPNLIGQLLMYPMIDDRDATISTQQFDKKVTWTRGSNLTGWTALLGERRGTGNVSIYAAPARATDLSNLPPAYIDCGSCEVFRDEDVAYATSIWAAGGQAELHVWPGGFHAYELFAPQTSLAREMVAARSNWVNRILGGD